MSEYWCCLFQIVLGKFANTETPSFHLQKEYEITTLGACCVDSEINILKNI